MSKRDMRARRLLAAVLLAMSVQVWYAQPLWAAQPAAATATESAAAGNSADTTAKTENTETTDKTANTETDKADNTEATAEPVPDAAPIGYSSRSASTIAASDGGISTFGVEDIYSTSYGMDAVANIDGTSAFGRHAQATMEDASAFGCYAQALGTNSSAFGRSATAGAEFSVALGSGAMANSEFSVALGVDAQAGDYNSMALGTFSQAGAMNSIALGTRSDGLYTNSVAIGVGSETTKANEVNFGYYTINSDGTTNNTIPYQNRSLNGISDIEMAGALTGVTKINGADLIVGQTNSSGKDGFRSLAFGVGATYTSKFSTVFGSGATATGASSSVFGSGATATGTTSSTFGTNSKATGASSSAFGMGALGEGDNSSAFGTGSKAKGLSSVALGSAAIVGNAYSVAIGSKSTTSADYQVSFGTAKLNATTSEYEWTNLRSLDGIKNITLHTDATGGGELIGVTKINGVTVAGSSAATGLTFGGNAVIGKTDTPFSSTGFSVNNSGALTAASVSASGGLTIDANNAFTTNSLKVGGQTVSGDNLQAVAKLSYNTTDGVKINGNVTTAGAINGVGIGVKGGAAADKDNVVLTQGANTIDLTKMNSDVSDVTAKTTNISYAPATGTTVDGVAIKSGVVSGVSTINGIGIDAGRNLTNVGTINGIDLSSLGGSVDFGNITTTIATKASAAVGAATTFSVDNATGNITTAGTINGVGIGTKGGAAADKDNVVLTQGVNTIDITKMNSDVNGLNTATTNISYDTGTGTTVDGVVIKSGAVSGVSSITMNGKITGVTAGTADSDAVNVGQMNTALTGKADASTLASYATTAVMDTKLAAKANADATGLSTENKTAWKGALGVDTLETTVNNGTTGLAAAHTKADANAALISTNTANIQTNASAITGLTGKTTGMTYVGTVGSEMTTFAGGVAAKSLTVGANSLTGTGLKVGTVNITNNKISGFTSGTVAVDNGEAVTGGVVYNATKDLAQQSDVTALQGTVGGHTTSINALQTKVGDESSGLVKDVKTNANAISTNAGNIQTNSSAISDINTRTAGIGVNGDGRTTFANGFYVSTTTAYGMSSAGVLAAASGSTIGGVNFGAAGNITNGGTYNGVTIGSGGINGVTINKTGGGGTDVMVGDINLTELQSGIGSNSGDITGITAKVAGIKRIGDGSTTPYSTTIEDKTTISAAGVVKTTTVDVSNGVATTLTNNELKIGGNTLTNTGLTVGAVNITNNKISGFTSGAVTADNGEAVTGGVVYTVKAGLESSIAIKANADATGLSDVNKTAWKGALGVSTLEGTVGDNATSIGTLNTNTAGISVDGGLTKIANGFKVGTTAYGMSNAGVLTADSGSTIGGVNFGAAGNITNGGTYNGVTIGSGGINGVTINKTGGGGTDVMVGDINLTELQSGIGNNSGDITGITAKVAGIKRTGDGSTTPYSTTIEDKTTISAAGVVKTTTVDVSNGVTTTLTNNELKIGGNTLTNTGLTVGAVNITNNKISGFTSGAVAADNGEAVTGGAVHTALEAANAKLAAAYAEADAKIEKAYKKADTEIGERAAKLEQATTGISYAGGITTIGSVTVKAGELGGLTKLNNAAISVDSKGITIDGVGLKDLSDKVTALENNPGTGGGGSGVDDANVKGIKRTNDGTKDTTTIEEATSFTASGMKTGNLVAATAQIGGIDFAANGVMTNVASINGISFAGGKVNGVDVGALKSSVDSLGTRVTNIENSGGGGGSNPGAGGANTGGITRPDGDKTTIEGSTTIDGSGLTTNNVNSDSITVAGGTENQTVINEEGIVVANGKTNQVTINKDGIHVGQNSSVMNDVDGFISDKGLYIGVDSSDKPETAKFSVDKVTGAMTSKVGDYTFTNGSGGAKFTHSGDTGYGTGSIIDTTIEGNKVTTGQITADELWVGGNKVNVSGGTIGQTNAVDNHLTATKDGYDYTNDFTTTETEGTTQSSSKVEMDSANPTQPTGNSESGSLNTKYDGITQEVNKVTNEGKNTETTNVTTTAGGMDLTHTTTKKDDAGNVTSSTTGATNMTGDSITVGKTTVTKDDDGKDVTKTSSTTVGSGEVTLNREDGSSIRVGDAIEGLQSDVQEMGSRINEMGTEIKEVGALSAALAGLHPQPQNANTKADFAMAMGSYEGKQALAVGAFYKPDKRTMLSVGASTTSSKHMMNMGISIALDRMPEAERKAQEDQAAAGADNETLNKVLERLASLEQDNQRLAKNYDAIKNDYEDLKAKYDEKDAVEKDVDEAAAKAEAETAE